MTVIGTVLPFSTSGGRSSDTRPLRNSASPISWRIACSICPGVFAAAGVATLAAPAAASPPAISASRRVMIIIMLSFL